MIFLGLTGPIACGKTTVLRLLEARGAKGIDADALVHDLMSPGRPVWRGIVAEFGQHILGTDKTIDRKQLGARVFSDQDAMRRLERIVHPATVAGIEDRLRSFQNEGFPHNQNAVVVLEAIKLIEGGYHRRCHAVWIVTCDPNRQIERLMTVRNLSREEAETRLRAQAGWSDKMHYADVIIRNNGTREQLEAQVDVAWSQLIARDNKETEP